MPVKYLGHAVLRVRNLERSLGFYRDVLGFRVVAHLGETGPPLSVLAHGAAGTGPPHSAPARGAAGRMVFLSTGEDHHDLALMEGKHDSPQPDPEAIGTVHLAFKVGDSLSDLREMKTRIEQAGLQIVGISDHKVSKSIYLLDPDGLAIEVYVDEDPAIWKGDPTAIATVRPFALD